MPGPQFEMVYDELRRLAVCRLRGTPPGQTLQATALVHEVFLKLFKKGDPADCAWESRAEFFAEASEAMRRIVIDHYRKKHCGKRGGLWRRLAIDAANIPMAAAPVDLLEIEEVLSQFEQLYPDRALVVKLRFFVGMTMEECAEALGTSVSTVERHWRFARAWMAERLESSS